ncbi:MAG: energy transducer TonB [Syntrophobacteraceae bacterium]
MGVETTPQGIFHQSALEAIQRWKFNTGRYRNNAVPAWVVQPILFQLA